jgi:HNH endonuclease
MANRANAYRNTPCWVWPAGTNGEGYGQVDHDTLAHRAAYEAFIGPIPDGHLVLHHCDNRPCCNPFHLFTGTHADNTADMIEKGRQRNQYPNPIALDVEAVADIKTRVARGETQRSVAAIYGVDPSHISRIVNGKAGVPRQQPQE